MNDLNEEIRKSKSRLEGFKEGECATWLIPVARSIDVGTLLFTGRGSDAERSCMLGGGWERFLIRLILKCLRR